MQEINIVAFCCNWCTYTGADLAGLNRMKYPCSVKTVRVPCSCRIDPQMVLKAFQNGCDGVMVCGCHPGDCHYTSGNYHTRRRMMLLKKLLEFTGLDMRRLRIRWISGAQAGKFRDEVTQMTRELMQLREEATAGGN